MYDDPFDDFDDFDNGFEYNPTFFIITMVIYIVITIGIVWILI